MAVAGVNCVRGRISIDEHRRCQLDPLHPCALTPDILEAMITPSLERERNTVVYSPSALVNCDRQDVLVRQGGDFYVDVEQGGWWVTRGHMGHAYAETLSPWPGVLGILREYRFRTEVDTRYGVQVFKGKPDAVVLNGVSIDFEGTQGAVLHVSVIDYKTKSEIGHDLTVATFDHQLQVNMYALLVERELGGLLNDGFAEGLTLNANVIMPHIDTVVVDELIIQYMDFKKQRRFTSAGSLKARGKRTSIHPLEYEELTLAPIRMMTPPQRLAWVRKHIERKIEAENELPPPLIGEDVDKQCHFCPVRAMCIQVGHAEGRDMSEQETA